MELSVLDLRILRYCLENGVMESEREIAKKLKISPSTLSFKFRKFEDSRVITAYRYRLDYAKLGLKKIAWALLKINFLGKGIKEIMQSFLSYPQVHVCLYTSGRYNVCLKIYGKSREEIEKFLEKLLRENARHVAKAKAHFVAKTLKSHNQNMSENMEAKVDKTDLKILQEKMLNPGMRLLELAKKLKLHRNTVTAKWNNIVKEKIVMKKTPIINPDLHRQVGIHFMAIDLFKAKKTSLQKLAKELARLNEVHELNIMEEDSRYNVLCVTRTNDMNFYYSILNNFLSSPKTGKEIEEINSKIIITSDSRRHTYLQDLGIENLLEKS